MRIHFERTGGFAGLRISGIVDTISLPTDEQKNLLKMVEAADFFNLPSTIHSDRSIPDGFQYVVTIEDGNRKNSINATGEGASSELQALLRKLTVLSRSKRT
jgi:hypothetical protein